MYYIDVTPETGKWYISEGFLSWPPSPVEKMDKHNQGRNKMILDGPFNTRDEAEAKLLGLAEIHHYPYIWECTTVAES